MSGKFKYWIIGGQAVFVLLLAAVSTRPIPFMSVVCSIPQLLPRRFSWNRSRRA